MEYDNYVRLGAINVEYMEFQEPFVTLFLILQHIQNIHMKVHGYHKNTISKRLINISISLTKEHH